MQDVVTAQTPVASDDVTHHECLGVSHVQVAGGVGEHVEHVSAFASAVVSGGEGLVLLPVRLPAFLRDCRVVAGALRLLCHYSLLILVRTLQHTSPPGRA